MLFRLGFFALAIPFAGLALFLMGWGLLGPYLSTVGKQAFAQNIAIVLVAGACVLWLATRFGLRDWGLRVLVLALPLFYTGCDAVTFPKFSYRMKVIATVEVGGREITEEAVWERQSSWQLVPLPDVGSGGERFIGDALIIDVGNNQRVALTMGNGSKIIRDAFGRYYEQKTGRSVPGRDRELPFLELFVGAGGPRSVLRFEVFVADLTPGIKQTLPPTSVKEFLHFPTSTSPEGFARFTREQLSSSGINITKIELETTSDPITRNIERHLPWYQSWSDKIFDGRTYYIKVPASVPHPVELRNVK